MEQEPFAVRHRFGDVDELGEITRAWDVDFRQLGRGPLEGSVTQWVTPSVQLVRVTLSKRVDQRGTPPRGLRTLSIPMDPDIQLSWRGHQVAGTQVLAFPRGGELESVSAPGFDMLAVSVDEGLLDDAASRRGQGGITRLLDENEVVTLPAPALGRLREGTRAVLEATAERHPSRSFARVHADLPALLVEALGSAEGKGREPAGTRVRIVREVMDLIRERGEHVQSVGDLCDLVGVTERSLQRGFREVAGVAPKQYMLAHRLSGVHRRLRLSDPARTRVADVANEWGFWHLGQLAADYRRHFGERPSETLRRRPGR